MWRAPVSFSESFFAEVSRALGSRRQMSYAPYKTLELRGFGTDTADRHGYLRATSWDADARTGQS